MSIPNPLARKPRGLIAFQDLIPYLLILYGGAILLALLP